MSHPAFLTRVRLKNYKSVGSCDVSLGPLSFLVGRNGAGKSNFLDALRFVADSLRTSLDFALRERGGIQEVRRRSGGHPHNFGVSLDFQLPDDQFGRYEFEIGSRESGGAFVKHEKCRVDSRIGLSNRSFEVRSGQLVSSTEPVFPKSDSDRLALVVGSGLNEFRPLYDALTRMAFYSLNPQVMRQMQPPDSEEVLARDGRNVPSALQRLARQDPAMKTRVEEYLASVVPGVTGVDQKALGSWETLEFRQRVAGAEHPWRFLASSMSDGTLRTLGILLALFQCPNGGRPRLPLVGIEEPEVALHPAAAGMLLDVVREASQNTQVIVTSHSADLLDNDEVSANEILAVELTDGETWIGPLDDVGVSALREKLYTVGELLRLDQLSPAKRKIAGRRSSQASLFDDDGQA